MKYEIKWSISALNDLKKLRTIISDSKFKAIYKAPEQIIFPEQFQINEYRKRLQKNN